MTAVIGWAPVLAPWPDHAFRRLEALIPARQFAVAMRYRRWQDRQARVLARLVLRKILQDQGIAQTLDDIDVTPEGRPFIPAGGDFSIAHTTTLALCAWVPEGRVGIDAETTTSTMTVQDMLPWMSDAERRRIAASPSPTAEALLLWTAKEAVCKADGCGITSGALPDCATSNVAFRGNLWGVRSKRRRGHVWSLARAAHEACVWRTFRLRADEVALPGSDLK